MSMSVIREYTEEDQTRVKSAAERFISRHNIPYDADFETAENAIDYWISSSHPHDIAYRRKLWTACYCRALRVGYDVRVTTGWGYIGMKV